VVALLKQEKCFPLANIEGSLESGLDMNKTVRQIVWSYLHGYVVKNAAPLFSEVRQMIDSDGMSHGADTCL
jgi:hypothetical protein